VCGCFGVLGCGEELAQGSTETTIASVAMASATVTTAPTTTTTTAPPPISGELVSLLADKVVQAEVIGRDITCVELKLRSLVDRSVNVVVPAGTFFAAAKSSTQNMIAVEEMTANLEPNGSVAVTIPAVCASLHREIPGEDDSFRITLAPSDELKKVALRLEAEEYPVRQAAVWIISDNASYDDLGILKHLGGDRVIREEEAAKALLVLRDAGIDIKSKRIWRDKQEILRGLKNEALKEALLSGQ